MSYEYQYVPCSSCSKRGMCKMCEKRIAKQRDQQRNAERKLKFAS
jgi:hypothetical protein